MNKIKIIAGILSLPVLIVLLSASAIKPDKPTSHTTGPFNEMNVVYGHDVNWKGADEQLDMNIFWPSNLEKGKRYPLVLLIHGGTFISGKKEGLDKYCQLLADSGFVAATINYRLGWKIPSPKEGCDADISDMANAIYRAYQDSRAALRFLVSNSEKYHIDKDWVFVGGNSAGGVAALGITYVDQVYADKNMGAAAKKLGGLDGATNALKDTYKIKGVCSMWGALPDSSLVTAATAVPAIMFHGTADEVVAYDSGRWRGTCPNFPLSFGSANLFRQLKRYNKPTILNSIIGAKHGPEEFKGHPEIVMSNTACFFHSVMRGDAHTASYTDAATGCR